MEKDGREGRKNKEIAAAFKVSVRTIQRVKVPLSVETMVQVKKKARRTHNQITKSCCLNAG